MKTLRILTSDGVLHMRDTSDVTTGREVTSLDGVVESVQAGQEYLRTLSVDDIIGFIDALAASWSQRASIIQQQYAPLGLNFLQYWFRASHLKQAADFSLRADRRHIDEFCEVDGQKYCLRAQPRGIIVHWLAGNVAMLGMLSLVQGIVTKNANILKVPRQNCDVIPTLLASFANVNYQTESGVTVDGKQLAGSIAAVYCEASDVEAQRAISNVAQVRVAWGGMDAVEAIMNLPRKYGSEDIIFGPRTSFAVIGREFLENKDDARSIAGKLANDASVFEQRGCNSPHTVFVETGGEVTPEEFAGILAGTMAETNRRIPRVATAPGETGKVLSLRVEYEMRGEAFYSENLDWTVLYAGEDVGLATPCFNRTLFVRPIDDVMTISRHCSHLTQTAGVALNEDRKIRFAEAVTAVGVDRVPNVGSMSLYEVPWDGLFTMDRMVRWVKL